MNKHLKIISIIICLGILDVKASTSNHLVSWNFFDITYPINSKLFFTESISPRIKNNLQEMDVVVLRSQLGYKPNNSVTLSQGYDWRARFNIEGDFENRLWQQVEYTKSKDKNKLGFRLRFEERFIDDQDFRMRLRPRIAYEYALTDTLSVELNDEMLFGFNENTGLEQNRILLNFKKQINDNLRLNLGYQFQHYFQGRSTINHAIVTRVEVFL